MPTTGGSITGYINGASDGPQDAGDKGERGYRRRRLAAMAGTLYRSGQQAVSEIRGSYAQARAGGLDDAAAPQGCTYIPGAFPDVAIASQGNEQMVLFPSYAKRHTKMDWSKMPTMQPQTPETGLVKDEEFWRQEWRRHEDERAVVDVDVRGWIYSSHTGPMTRRNRILVGLARQLSGISVPRTDQSDSGLAAAPGHPQSQHQMHQAMGDQAKIAREAARIEQRGQEERQVASSGGYSEQPLENGGGLGVDNYRARRRGSRTPVSEPASPVLSARQTSSVGELTEAELAVANANLMARIAPFMTNPLVALPITIFFYNDTQSQSRTVMTNDAGHFVVRAPLDFVPTNARVLANENLSATQEVKIVEPRGVSLISDVDDTIKHSNISAGAREIFRNTFVRELADLTVDGVEEWYNKMHRLGVSIHYCSNSPWQLFPVLASFFKLGGLPPGSLHLKQYSGMLQGIFEPVAERKRTTLNHLMEDFPERKFLLVGDSGEADLEVYTELALENLGRILAVFIRDVTTPEKTGFFDSAFDLTRGKPPTLAPDDDKPPRGKSAPRQNSAPTAARFGDDRETQTGPVMGTLIDVSDEPEQMKVDQSASLHGAKNGNPSITVGAMGVPSERKAPPPRPAKPVALRSAPSTAGTGPGASTRPSHGFAGLGLSMAKPAASKSAAGPSGGLLHPLSHTYNLPQRTTAGNNGTPRGTGAPEGPPIPPLPHRRTAPLPNDISIRLSTSTADIDFEPLPSSAATPPPLGLGHYRYGSRSGAATPSGSPTLGAQGANKKLELWKRRLARAHEQLDRQGVALYTWRRGQDVVVEAAAIVQRAFNEMGKEKRKTQRKH